MTFAKHVSKVFNYSNLEANTGTVEEWSTFNGMLATGDKTQVINISHRQEFLSTD